jgi:hypothetical protein
MPPPPPCCRNAIREQITALINPVPTVLSQVTAACPVFNASTGANRSSRGYEGGVKSDAPSRKKGGGAAD